MLSGVRTCSGRLRRIFVQSCRSIARIPRITFTFCRRSSLVQLYSAPSCSARCMLDWLCPSAIFLARTDGAISKRRFKHDTLICFGKGTSSVAEVSGMPSSSSRSDIHRSSDESSTNSRLLSFFFRLVFPFFNSTGHLFDTTSFVFQDGNSAL